MTDTTSSDDGPIILQSGLPTFLKAPWVPCDEAALREHGARAAILGIPFDQATVYLSGTNMGPKGMRIASDQFLPYLGDFGIDLFEEFRLVDCGDVPVVPGDAARSRIAITEYVGRILDAGAIPICLGGDDSIPIPIGDALESRVESFGYLKFDTHIDAALDVSGERNTNWSGTARTAERERVDPGNVAVVGIHGATNPLEQFRYADAMGINLYTMGDVITHGIEAVVTDALDRVTDGTEGFYVSFDTDVVDAASMPGTGGPEPGGMTSREILRAAELVGARDPRVVDIDELLPGNDFHQSISCRLCCYFLFHLLGAAATGGKRSGFLSNLDSSRFETGGRG